MMKTSIGFWSSEQNIREFPCQMMPTKYVFMEIIAKTMYHREKYCPLVQYLKLERKG